MLVWLITVKGKLSMLIECCTANYRIDFLGKEKVEIHFSSGKTIKVAKSELMKLNNLKRKDLIYKSNNFSLKEECYAIR